jgi:hypothetical protein
MSVYNYIAESNPYFAKGICHKYGYETTNIRSKADLGQCLKRLVANEGEPAFRDIMENHPEKSLVDCNPKGFNFQENKTTPEGCSPSPDSLDFLEDSFRNEKTNLGKSNLGDPMQTGHILNDGTNFNTIYRYSKAFCKCRFY